MKKSKFLLIFLSSLILLASCDVPQINNVEPTPISEGFILKIEGSDILFSKAEWDGNPISTPWIGASFITIPYGTSIGNHNLTLSNSHGTSTSKQIQVVAPQSIPSPIIHGVQISQIDFTGAQIDSTSIMIYGSNIDVGAEILVNGNPIQTWTHQVLMNEFCPDMTNSVVDSLTLGNPKFHYVSLITQIKSLAAGSTVNFTVKNLDNDSSPNYSFTFPTSLNLLDSDGDGLLDDWEENGYDADNDGVIDVDLPAMGASERHYDLFVEVDIMNGLSYTPSNAMWSIVESSFENAPIMNLDGEKGIKIHIDRGQGGLFTNGGTTLTYKDEVDFSQASNATIANFYTEKNANFDSDRLNIFRYCIWSRKRFASNSSGRAEGIWSNDFIVSTDHMSSGANSNLSHAETFMHELGHTLDFGHGGNPTDSRFDEPNHISIMSYCWQFLSIQNDCITCRQCYDNTSPDYSEGMFRDLNETSLNENIGVCDNISVDWNLNGTIENNIQFNINPDDGTSNTETLDDYDEWHNLKYSFTAAGSNWGSN